MMAIGDIPPAQARVVHIRNTLNIHKFSVSHGYATEVGKNSALNIINDWEELKLDPTGNIKDPF